MSEHVSGDADPRKAFAEELKSARELYPSGSLTQEALARLVKTSKSTISRLESGKGHIPPAVVPWLDQVFSTDGLFKRLYEQCVAADFPELYRRRMELERGAVQIWEWAPAIIPGLLQTEEYARALLRAGPFRATEQEVSSSVAKRLARQQIFAEANPPDVRVVMCESVLARRVLPREAMLEQLAALLTFGEQPTTRIQILPLDAEAHPLIDSPASVLTSPSLVSTVYVETYRMTGIIEDPVYVRPAQRAFESLLSEAHPARKSADLIRETMEKL
ncbi:helix-turn-helix domain-containing protein [Streptomyces sp. NBC_01197]|uniref:helix-turn-helix domain-containing protein n=1 Tax=Streptomyces sp. NBC_01197 TaxID=2903768 RepID=UPI002E0FC9A4|nr:helix-turn-helix domain-containing protein [Streptomyces sp. NBC_01197]